MVQISTQTGLGHVKTRYEYDLPDAESFRISYEEITELLILLQSEAKKPFDDNPPEFPLRKSLFAHVAPYVNFQLHDSQGIPSLPKEITKHMTWELGGTTTPWIVRKTVENSGYRTVNGCENWCGTWSECRYAICYKILKKDQKINHFPGTYEIGHKDKLWKNMSRLTSVFGKKQFDFIPRTFILPQDFDELRSAWERNKSKNRWIIKPTASSRGRGISVVSRWTQIPRNKSLTIVQRYLSNPKLIDNSKFDLRIYVLVTSFNPLKIYVHSEGLVRFACAPYESGENSLGNKFIHLTNYSVNRFSKNYVKNDTIDQPKGHKWSLKCLWDYLKARERDVKKLRLKINDIIVKSIISAESSVSCFSRVHLSSKHNCYELLGFDILIDESLKPWLLEVNISPSLHAPSILDVFVKGRLVKDVLNVAGYRLPSTSLLPPEILRNISRQYDLGYTWSSQDVRASERELSSSEKRKQMDYMYHSKDRGDCVESVIDNLTPDDVRCLIQYEDELRRLGDFEKVFPTKNSHKYFKYFEAPRYYNLLLSAWEIDNHSDHRKKGIQRLRDLCERKFHLRR